MRKRVGECCALGALIALVAYGLACVYPTGWSPDSRRVVFPVLEKSGQEDLPLASALVMTDLSGKVIRQVACPAPGSFFSPAAWSPDGCRIAYFRFEDRSPRPTGHRVGRESKSDSLQCFLMVQDAATGSERRAWECTVSGEHAFDLAAGNLYLGPQWMGETEVLGIDSMSDTAPAALALDVDGKLLRQIPLTGAGKGGCFPTFSPDGKRLAFYAGKDDPSAVIVADAHSGQIVQTIPRPEDGKWGFSNLPPAWSPDSRALYVAIGEDAARAPGRILRVTIGREKPATVWEGAGPVPVGVSISRRSPRLAVTTAEGGSQDLWEVSVMDPASGRMTPIHLSREYLLGAAISPDGRWVAYSAFAAGHSEAVGVIASSDGAELRFFAPGPDAQASVAAVVRERLGLALEVLGQDERLPDAHVSPQELADAGKRHEVLAAIRRVEAHQTAPLFQEALAYAGVMFCLDALEKSAPSADPALPAEARRQVDRFLAAYPGHPLAQEIEARLTGLLAGRPHAEKGRTSEGRQ